ncbi:ketopantoate reductase family protein [Dysgonomonas mossii]|uniref:Ketopantoate reductase family protein n=1 Tax=Dysgonomonas mossii TaxID=163665 RepID=A0A4Y9IJC0_9BACT|nr:2-dehydropantoate 2-reductase N-terminal domain-containing protein [Dysgonomonas mossii]MBF0762167.1 ketopantoate reductase family protein [Dysgonomonas mossii]TFU87222.1 ketopantoate reductase family protein [Dysgonomonas mossii]
MKILIYGAGIVGCTYGWQLSEAGCDITVLVRPGKKESIKQEGITINYSDFRSGTKIVKEIVFRPKVIDCLLVDNDFEYIIVTTNNLHLTEILPILKESAGQAHILFFLNMWIDDFREIEKYLSPNQYLFGFPFMAGGGRENNVIHSAISGLKYSHTPLGETDGSITPRVQKIADALEKSNLKPMLYKQIKVWLITHYAVAAGLSAGIIMAGGGKAFSSDTEILRHTFKAIREGLKICSKIGFDSKSEKSNKLYYLPLFIGTAIAKKVYSNEALCLMFDGHTQHSPDEMQKMLNDIIDCGKNHNIQTPYLSDFEEKLKYKS